MRRLGMADFLGGRLRRGAAAGSPRRTRSPRRAATGAAQAWSLQNLAWVTTTRGDFAGADAALGRAARLFAELRRPVRAGPGCAAPPRSPGCSPAGCTRRAGWPGSFLPFGERVGEAWAVGTLRAVEAFAAAELGELAEADREARRAYRDFAAARDDWGRGFALVVRGRGGPRAGRAGARGRPAHRRPARYGERTAHPLLIGMAGTHARVRRAGPGRLRGGRARTPGRCSTAVEPHNPLAPAQVGAAGAARRRRGCAAGDPATAVGLLAPMADGRRDAPSLLFSRRQALARYASALLADGQREQALDWARRAVAAPAEDVRSRVMARPGAGRGAGRRRPAGGGAGQRARRRSAGVRDRAAQRAGRRGRAAGPAGRRRLTRRGRLAGRRPVEPNRTVGSVGSGMCACRRSG